MNDKPMPPRNHMDPATKDAYIAELEAFALQTEFSMNKLDSAGDRCPVCKSTARDGHSGDCKIGKVCDRVRAVREAHRLLGLA